MKKFYCCIILSIIAFTCRATNIDGISYEIDTSSKTAKVVDLGHDYEGHPPYVGDIVIPETFGITKIDRFGESHTVTYTVTAIGSGAFSANMDLTSVVIPNTVTLIEYGAFEMCLKLASVTIGNSVETIQNLAFADCISLTSLVIPNSVKEIGDRAFGGLSNLKNLHIGSGVEYLGRFAFESCKVLENIYCYATVVPSAGADTFIDTNKATIYVPSATVEKYQSTYPWSVFTIMPLDETNGISPQRISPTTTLRKYIYNGHIIVDKDSRKFNIGGQMVE